NGGVSVTGVTGDKNIRTSNGAIHLKKNAGAAEVHTSNGSISVDGGKGRLQLESSNGAIHVQGDEATVAAHTSNGSVHFHGTLLAGKHSFQTTNGGVALALPPNSRFHIDARTTHGGITSDFFKVKKPRGPGAIRVSTDVGENPELSILAESTNGNICIRKAS